MTIKGAVFDLDGLLLDTEGMQLESWLEVLKPHGIFMTKHDYLDYAGKTGSIIEAELISKYRLNVRKGQLLEEKEKLLRKWIEDRRIYLMPFVRETIGFFTARRMKIAVASGGSKTEVLGKLKKASLYEIFETIVTKDDVSRGKPHPDIYQLAVRKLGLAPQECLAFEDTEFGVQSAKLAGLACIAIPNEFSQKQDFRKADGISRNLGDALKLAQRKFGL